MVNSNVGNRLLQAMGWKNGKGLGKSERGITVPVQVGSEAFQPMDASMGRDRRIDR